MGDLAVHTELQRLWISGQTTLDLEEVGALTGLTHLWLWLRLDGSFEALRSLTRLKVLATGELINVPNYEIMTAMPNLDSLYLYGGEHQPTMEFLSRIPGLICLSLTSPRNDLTLAAVARALPQLTELALFECPWIDDLTPVAGRRFDYLTLNDSSVRDTAPLESCRGLGLLGLGGSRIERIDALAKHDALWWLNLRDTAVADLSPLAENRSTRTLVLDGCQELCDLSPLATLPSLDTIELRGARQGLDLSPLAGKKVTIHLYEGQEVCGLDALGRRAKIEWSTPPEESTTT
jgi:hypothetical protein